MSCRRGSFAVKSWSYLTWPVATLLPGRCMLSFLKNTKLLCDHLAQWSLSSCLLPLWVLASWLSVYSLRTTKLLLRIESCSIGLSSLSFLISWSGLSFLPPLRIVVVLCWKEKKGLSIWQMSVAQGNCLTGREIMHLTCLSSSFRLQSSSS